MHVGNTFACVAADSPLPSHHSQFQNGLIHEETGFCTCAFSIQFCYTLCHMSIEQGTLYMSHDKRGSLASLHQSQEQLLSSWSACRWSPRRADSAACQCSPSPCRARPQSQQYPEASAGQADLGQTACLTSTAE